MMKLVLFATIVAVACADVRDFYNKNKYQATRTLPVQPTFLAKPDQAPALPVQSRLSLPVQPTFFRKPVAPVVPVAPFQPKYAGPQIRILKSDSDVRPDGSYYYIYETENGISAQEQGSLKNVGDKEPAVVASGSYYYTSPEGVPVQITYVADENGFQPQGDILPTPPPIPEAILRSIQFNEAEERKQPVPYRQY